MVDLSQVYNQLKAQYGRAAAALHPALTLPPLRITFEVTYRCNLSCAFCFQEIAREESPEFRKDFELGTAEILGVVDELPRTCLITLNGGEVFVRRDFPELLRALTGRGRRFNLVTNGTMLFADKARLLVEEVNALSVGFSIDGIGELHDQIRRLPGAYERTVDNLRGLVAHRKALGRRLPLVDMKTVITPENCHQLAEIYQVARQIGADYCTLSCLRTSGLILSLPCRASMADGDYDQYPPPLPGDTDLEVLEEQLRAVAEMAAAGGPQLRFYPAYSNIEGILKYYANQGELGDYLPCKAPWTNIRVAPNGDVYPCLAYRMGNIREEGIMAVWRGARMNQFRQVLKGGLVPGCMGCCFLTARERVPFAPPARCQAALA
jgi:MoaA/NifB/PqqE/SkfB family radical SAM enzyme